MDKGAIQFSLEPWGIADLQNLLRLIDILLQRTFWTVLELQLIYCSTVW